MYQKMNRFVSHFRELEKQEVTPTNEEEKRWHRLKEKLSMPAPEDKSHYQFHRVIVIASFYAQAGASFLASNFAYQQAGKEVRTVLSEAPGQISYYYFALDGERRGNRSTTDSSIRQVSMQNGFLRIKMDASLEKGLYSQSDIANWFLWNSKEASLFIIDMSSNWRGELASYIMGLADEIWFVLDTDFPRLTRLMLTEQAPEFWNSGKQKTRFIANKWNQELSRAGIIKRIEGTLSLWDTDEKTKRVDAFFPLLQGEKVSNVQSTACLLLEKYPEEEKWFDQLAFS